MDIKEIKQQAYSILERSNKLISLSLFLLILAIGFLMYLKPFYDRASLNMEEMKNRKEAILTSKQKKLNDLSKLSNEIKNIEDIDREKINKIMPEEKSHSDLFPQIEYIALRNGLFVKTISYAEVTKPEHLVLTRPELEENLGVLKINMVVTGATYNGLKKFLEDIENNVRVMDVNNLSFSLSGKSINLDAFAYYWKK